MESESEPMPSPSRSEHQAALDAIQAANRQMAARAEVPAWRHAILGVLAGGLVAVQAAPIVWRMAYYAAYCVGLFLFVRAYRRHTGMWIPGYRAGRTRWVAVGAAALVAALFLGAIWAATEQGLIGAYYAGALLVALCVTAAGHVWQWAYRRDLGDI
jgi:hypothetical protein